MRLPSGTNCLSPYGPLGAYGALNSLGPLGPAGDVMTTMAKAVDASMTGSNVDNTVASMYAWGKKQPLSADGPLGSKGVFGDSYKVTMLDANSAALPLGLEGMLTVLGPFGPLGPLGALGALGPRGAFAAAIRADGSYFKVLANGQQEVVRYVDVPYKAGSTKTRRFPLMENYPSARAQAFDYMENDCSWFTKGSFSGFGATGKTRQSFKFHSDQDQYVTLVVSPTAQLDSIGIELFDGEGVLLARSMEDSAVDYINWLQVKVKKGTQLRVEVILQKSRHMLPSHGYQLHVVGSTQYFNQAPAAGMKLIQASAE